jgi:multiple sugar transport system substrate-binding protein
MNWKKTCSVLFLVMIMSFASACGNKGDGTPDTSSSATSSGSSDNEKVDLTWSVWGGQPSDEKTWKSLADEVTKKYPNIHLTIQMTDWNTYWTKLTTQMASGTASDIVSLQSLRVPGYAKNGFLPLNDYIKQDKEINFEDFNKSIIDGLSLDNNVYALPYDFGPIVMYYNKELFDKYKVPYPTENMTWSDFVDTSKKLTHPDQKEYGTIVVPEIDYALPFIFANKGEIITKDQKYTLDTPENAEAVQWVADLINKEKVAPPIVTGNHMIGEEQFSTGKIGMFFVGPWDVSYFKDKAKFKYAISTMPKGKDSNISWSAGSGFGISKNSKHADAAWKAVSVLTNQTSSELLASTGRGYPGRASALPSYFGQEGLPENAKLIEKQPSKPYVTTTTWQEAYTNINTELEAILLGRETAADGLKKMQSQLATLKDK